MKPKPLTILLSLTFLFLFSGFVYGQEPEVKKEFWGNGKLKKETHSVSGEKNGLETVWYESGRKREESNFKNGEKDGVSTAWDEEGRKKWEGHYAVGKLDGPVTRWNENGLKHEVRHYKAGNEAGRTEWYENGNKSYEDDGNHRSTMWNKNGKKVQEEYLVDGFNDDIDDGSLRMIVTFFYPSGEKSVEAHVKDGYTKDGPSRYFYRSGEIMRDEYYKDGKKEGLVKEW